MIAITHPGLIGDCLWCVPAAREIARRHGPKVDFWTSRIVEPATDLLAAQEFVERVIVDPGYHAVSGDCGAQPWHMRNADLYGYDSVYHMGLRETPSVPIPEYYCRLHNLPQLPNRYDLPADYAGRDLPKVRFVALAARGTTTFAERFREFVRHCPHPVVEVGAPGQAVAGDLGAIDRTSKGFLEMTWVISRCHWFVGLLSSPMVVASGFPCVKIGLYDHHWDMRHVIHTPLHHYVGDVEWILRLVEQ